MTRIRKPPQVLEGLLQYILPRYVGDTALGDFEEEYEYIASKQGLAFANLWYVFQIIKSIPAFVIDAGRGGGIMLKNYIITSFRYLTRHKTFSFINIFGMSIALACCLLILLFIRNELTYDRFHENSDYIYRIYTKRVSSSGKVSYHNFTPAPLADPILNETTGVENLTRIGISRPYWVFSGEKSIKAEVAI